jgi:hypothetical protein
MKSVPPMRAVQSLVLLAALGCARTPDDRVVLKQPDATLPGTFGQVVGLTELTDGRVALADFKARQFIYGSFSPARLDTVGQHADSIALTDPAPGQHKLPGIVLHLGGDTVGLIDFATQRATLWSEKGSFLATLHTMPVAGANPAVVYDTLGHAYKADYRAILGGLNPGVTIRTDSAPVLRFARENAITADTIALLKLPEFGEGQFGEDKKNVPVVYAPSDVFGVSPDGWLWVARAGTNSVDWRSPDGKWTAGAARTWTVVPVTAADKERFMAAARAGGMNLQTGVTFPFAANKPPFTSAASGQDGTAWLQRARAFEDSVPVYDVIGRTGALLRTVQLPKGTSLAGVGRTGTLYVVIRDGDFQRVGRYEVH